MPLVFSYGSNNPKQLSERIGRRIKGTGAYLPKFGRVFRGWSNNWGGGVASVVPDSSRNVYGYVADVDADELYYLDRKEGVLMRRPKYERISKMVMVRQPNGSYKRKRAQIYVSLSDEFNPPTRAYLNATAKTIDQFWRGRGDSRITYRDIPIRNPKGGFGPYGSCTDCGSAIHECECPSEAELEEYERQKMILLRRKAEQKRYRRNSDASRRKVQREIERLSEYDNHPDLGYIMKRWILGPRDMYFLDSLVDDRAWDPTYEFYDVLHGARERQYPGWTREELQAVYDHFEPLEDIEHTHMVTHEHYAGGAPRHSHYHKNPRRYRRNREALNMDYGPVSREGQMLKSQLMSMQREANKLYSMLEDGDNLPGWVNSKISTALDRLSTSRRYIESKLARMGYDY